MKHLNNNLMTYNIKHYVILFLQNYRYDMDSQMEISGVLFVGELGKYGAIDLQNSKFNNAIRGEIR